MVVSFQIQKRNYCCVCWFYEFSNYATFIMGTTEIEENRYNWAHLWHSLQWRRRWISQRFTDCLKISMESNSSRTKDTLQTPIQFSLTCKLCRIFMYIIFHMVDRPRWVFLLGIAQACMCNERMTTCRICFIFSLPGETGGSSKNAKKVFV